MQAYMGGIVPTYLANSRKNSSMAIFLAGCDYNCPHCNTPEYADFKEEYLTNLLDIKKEITNNSNMVDSIFFTGGEPCLQRQALLSLSRHARAADLKIGLQTNGSKPSTIKSLLNENFIDFIELKLQSDFNEENFEKATKSKNFFNPTSNILESIYETLNLLKKHDTRIEIFFVTDLIKGINDDMDMLDSLANKIQDIRATWIIKTINVDLDEEESETQIQNNKKELEPVTRGFLEEAKIRLEDKYPYLIIELQ